MSEQPKNLYARAGITDLAEFYRTRYVSDELLDPRYFDAINRFDIRWARTMWVYDNVRPAWSVLDLGCGGGVLALVKRKNVMLYGIDISRDCASISKRNGYDATYVARLTELPFADASFDAVVSLDVMGHVEFEEKEGVLSEIARVLKPGGVTLHGIECLDRAKRKDYHEMDQEELRRFISIDGHVGMEDEAQITARFRRFFKHVRAEPRFAVCQGHEEFIKQADEYGTPLCDADFMEYLRGMSFQERRAFNMAMGFVFEKISEMEIAMPKSEYLLLKASHSPLGSFYKEDGDRGRLFPISVERDSRTHWLDHSTRASFDAGWYDAEMLPPVARWMGRRARLRFEAESCSALRLDVTTHMPELDQRPLALEFFMNGEPVLSLSLIRTGWVELEMENGQVSALKERGGNGIYELEIRASRTWQPRADDAVHRDDRELSIAVCNIEALP